MSQNAFDVGAPIPTVNAAVEARMLSALKNERVVAEPGAARTRPRLARRAIAGRRRSTPRASALREQDHLCTRRAWRSCAWPRRSTATGSIPATVAKIWRAGCIIRAGLLGDIRDAFARNAGLVNLLLDDALRDASSRMPGELAVRRADRRRPWHSRAGDERRRSRTTTRTAARGCRRTSTQAQRDFLRRAHVPPRRSRRRLLTPTGRQAARSQ